MAITRAPTFVPAGSSGKCAFRIRQGETLNESIRVQFAQALTVTGAALQVRATKSHPTVLLELSSAAGTIDIANYAGYAILTLDYSNVQTAALDWGDRTAAVYDMEITLSNGTVVRVLDGSAVLDGEATR